MLFAPLAQAQVEDSGVTTVNVIAPGIRVEATEVFFGNVALHETSDDSVGLFCISDLANVNVGTNNNLAITGAKCGAVTVSSAGVAVDYQITAEVNALTHVENGTDTLTPNLNLATPAGSPIFGPFDPDTTRTSANITLPLDGSHTYFVWGSIDIAAADTEGQAAGEYRGEYTITVTPQ